MSYSKGIRDERNHIAVNVAENQKRIAYEKSRVKPEDANPLAKRTIFMVLASIFKAIWKFFGFGRSKRVATMQPYNPPKHYKVSKGKRNRTHNAMHVTPPRAFGSSRAGTKLSKGIKEVHHA